jgi:DNA-binding transcriptional MerR regulator
MLKIGEFGRLAKVSVKLLRHYHDCGVLTAHSVDRETGYRYYTVQQLAALNRLLVYRRLGFSLREVASLMRRDASADDLRGMLTARRSALAAQVESERARLAEVEARIAYIEKEGCVPRYEAAIRTVSASRALSLRRECTSYDEVCEMLTALRSAVSRRTAVKGTGAIWHSCGAGGTRIDCEALVFADAANCSRIGAASIELPECTVATIVHDDSAEDVSTAYRAALERASMLGYRRSGPMREIYLSGGRGGGPAMTEVQFPLARSMTHG